MTNHIIRNAEYQDTGVHAYKDNPFIEALPPIQEPFEDTKNLISKVMPTLDCEINSYLDTHSYLTWTLWSTYKQTKVLFNLDRRSSRF